jgi:SAM-dependent methyltransferase
LPFPVDPYQAIDFLYDAEHRAFDDDVNLLQTVADEMNGPLLELGCGSGRVLVPLAERGHPITGIDLSAPMLARATDALRTLGEAGSAAAVVKLDMRDADEAPGGPFAMAIYSLNGLMHLTTQEEQIRSLTAVGRALMPNGTVFIDLMNATPDYLERIAGVTHLEWNGEFDGDLQVQKWSHREIDVHAQTIDTRIWYDLTAADGTLRRVHSAFTLRYLHLAELHLMLQTAGFRSTVVYGSYDLDPLEGRSERMIVTAENCP